MTEKKNATRIEAENATKHAPPAPGTAAFTAPSVASATPATPTTPDQSETEGRIGEGKNAGVRNVPGGTQRSEASDLKRTGFTRDPDVRVGARGVMQQDIGASICLQDGNDCR